MDPWDVPEPKTLKAIPKGKKSVDEVAKETPAPSPLGLPEEPKEVFEPPPLRGQPAASMEAVSPPKFEVITTPPPARERVRAEGEPKREPAPTIIPTHISDIEDEAPTEEINRSPVGVDDDDDILIAQSNGGSTKMLVAGGVFGVVLAVLVLGFVYLSMTDSESGTVPASPATTAPVQNADEVPVKEPDPAPPVVEEKQETKATTEESAAPKDTPSTEVVDTLKSPNVASTETQVPAVVTPSKPVSPPIVTQPKVTKEVPKAPAVNQPAAKKEVQRRPRPTAVKPAVEKPRKPPAPKPKPPEEPKEEEIVEELDNPWGDLD